MTIALQNLLKNSVRFGHFQFKFYAGQFDGLNQTITLWGLQKANKIFQPNLGSGQTSQSDLDFNRGKNPVIKSLSADIPGTTGTSTRYRIVLVRVSKQDVLVWATEIWSHFYWVVVWNMSHNNVCICEASCVPVRGMVHIIIIYNPVLVVYFYRISFFKKKYIF